MEPALDRSLNAFAVWTVACHLTVWLDGSARTVLLLAIPLLGAWVGCEWLGSGRRLPAPTGARSDRRLVLVCATVLLLTGLAVQRPDADDGFYFALINSVADRPGEPLLGLDPIHGVDGLAIPSSHHRYRSLEVLTGTVARLTGTPSWPWQHLLLPALGAVAACLALAELLPLLAPGGWRWALVGATAVLLTIGETHHWPGNFGILRLHQGKSWLPTVVLPLVMASAIRFACRPSRREWARLLALQIAAVGLSPAGLWMPPVVAGCGLLAARFPPNGRLLLAGIVPSAYPLLVGLSLRSSIGPRLASSMAMTSADALVARTVDQVVDHGTLRWVVVLALPLALAVASPAGRRLLLLLAGGVSLCLLPAVAEPVSQLLTGRQLFWRVTWLAPMPVLLGLALAAIPAAVKARPLRAPFFLAALGLLCFLVPERQLLSRENGVGPGGWRPAIPPAAWAATQRVVDRSGPGDLVVVPFDLAPWIPVHRHHPHLAALRPDYLTGPLRGKEHAWRLVAASWVSGRGRPLLERPAWEALLRRRTPPLIVLGLPHPAAQWWSEHAPALGYHLVERIASYELWAHGADPPSPVRRRGQG